MGKVVVSLGRSLLSGLDEGEKLCVSSACPQLLLSSKQEDTQKLTDQQQALNRGQNPLPIYLSLNVKDKISDQDFRGNHTSELLLTFNPIKGSI